MGIVWSASLRSTSVIWSRSAGDVLAGARWAGGPCRLPGYKAVSIGHRRHYQRPVRHQPASLLVDTTIEFVLVGFGWTWAMVMSVAPERPVLRWPVWQWSALLHRPTAVRADIESMTGQPADALAVTFRRRRFWRRRSQQGSTERQLPGAVAIGEEADMTDAVEAIRHGVQQEPADEFVGAQRHDLGLATVAIVLPGEVDITVLESDQTRVGDGDAMGVAAQIGQHCLRASEGRFGVNDPVNAGEIGKAFGEDRGVD